MKKYIDIEKVIEKNGPYMEKSDVSDIVRIKLLSKYGGVWVDSTCMCQKPLDTWIHEYMNSGFFAFSNPTKDRKLASWFMASEKDNYLAEEFRTRYVDYFRENEFKNQKSNFGNYLKVKLEGILNVSEKTSLIWFSYPIKKIIKVYSYFTFHYKFSETCYKDSKARSIWKTTPKYSAGGPLKAIRNGLTKKPNPELKEEILNRKVPMYKLNWGVDIENAENGTTIMYILENNPYLKNK